MQTKLLLIGQLSLQTIGTMLISPIFWLTLGFTYRYYRQYEWDKASARKLALASSFEGICSGFLVIWLIAVLGLVVKPSAALLCMGPISMLLSLYRPRFLCMSYGAGVTVLSFWLLHQPVDAVGIMSLVAILHLAEGVLVLCFGSHHAITIYQQSKRRLLPSRGIYCFWPVPICLMIAAYGQAEVLHMPGWWPLLPLEVMNAETVCGLLPLAVTLGYSDLAAQPRKIRENGLLILAYALILLAISLAAVKCKAYQAVGMIFMVGGHEVIVKGRSWMRHEKI